MNSMIIASDNGTKTYHLCPACKPTYVGGAEPCNETIPIYYSEQHATDEGWRKTKHQDFCEPGKKYVWVCP